MLRTTVSPAGPAREEIDNHIMKLLVGLMALSLATLTSLFAEKPLGSISESYWAGGWSQTIFLGFLFAIAAFLFAYNGKKSNLQMILSKVAALAAVCVAMFPCDCDCTGEKYGKPGPCEIVENVHFMSAAVMFIILAFFCYTFLRRSLEPKDGEPKVYTEAKVRAVIYGLCGLTIVAVIVSVFLDWVLSTPPAPGPIVSRCPEFIFWAEAAGLVAFGISWLIASRTIPIITNDAERYSLSPWVQQREG